MPRIGNQRHMRVRPRRRISSINSSKNRQGFFKTTIEVTALAFVFLTIYLFVVVQFIDNPPAKATLSTSTAAAAAGDHYPVSNGKRFTLDIPASPPSPPPPHMMLRGPRKQSNDVTGDDSNGSAINGVTKGKFSLLEGKAYKRKLEADIIMGIEQGNDAAIKAAQAAVEAERAAVMAVTEAAATLSDEGLEGGKAWDESVMGGNAS